MSAPTTSPAAEEKVAVKKPFHVIADAYVACLLGEIIAYQHQLAAYREITKCHIPDRDVKAAAGATNTAKDIYSVALAYEQGKTPPSVK